MRGSVWELNYDDRFVHSCFNRVSDLRAFALTSSPPGEEEFPFFALLTFLAGSPKHITLGLLQQPPKG